MRAIRQRCAKFDNDGDAMIYVDHAVTDYQTISELLKKTSYKIVLAGLSAIALLAVATRRRRRPLAHYGDLRGPSRIRALRGGSVLNRTDVHVSLSGQTLEEALARNALGCSRVVNVGDAHDAAMSTLMDLAANDSIGHFVNTDEDKDRLAKCARFVTSPTNAMSATSSRRQGTQPGHQPPTMAHPQVHVAGRRAATGLKGLVRGRGAGRNRQS